MVELHPAITAFIEKQFQYPEVLSSIKRGPKYYVNIAQPSSRATAVFDLEGEWIESRYLISQQDLPTALTKSLSENFYIDRFIEIVMKKRPFEDNIYLIVAQTQFSRIILKGDESGWFMIDRVEDIVEPEII